MTNRLSEVVNLVASMDIVTRASEKAQPSRTEVPPPEPSHTESLTIRASMVEVQDALHETSQMLQSILKPQQHRAKSSSGLCFPFNIILTQPSQTEMTGRVQLDTGCEENWIRTELLTRAGLQEQMQPFDEAKTYIGFGGTHMSPAGCIQITWFSENESLTRISRFLVHSDVPFDAVLGRESILEDAGVAFSKAIVALRHLDLDEGKCRYRRLI